MKPLIFFCLLLTSQAIAQSPTVDRFREQHKTQQNLYFYPSTLRMINVDKNPDYYALVRHLDALQVLSFSKAENTLDKKNIQQFQQNIRRENYQELLSLDEKQRTIRLYALGNGNVPEGIIGFIDSPQSLTLIEMEGFVDMPALLRLMQSDFNFGKFTQLINTTAEQKRGNDQPRQQTEEP